MRSIKITGRSKRGVTPSRVLFHDRKKKKMRKKGQRSLNIGAYKSLLLEKQKYLQDKLRSELKPGESVRVAEDLEWSAEMSEVHQRFAFITHESAQLQEICSALEAIKNNAYGICEKCEREIPEKRLAAVPWAARCVRCQEATDRNGHGFKFDGELGLANA